MKKLLPIFLMFFICSHAQVKDLGELSSGKFLDSRIVYNDDGENDVYGYLLMYQKDTKSKAVYDLEYVLLDKNLNKLTNVLFVQNRIVNITQVDIKFAMVTKSGNKIIIGLYDYSNSSFGALGKANYRYRELDLTSYKLSEQFVMKNMQKTYEQKADDSKVTLKDFKENLELIAAGNSNFIVFEKSGFVGKVDGHFYDEKLAKDIHGLKVYDKNIKEVWEYKFNPSGQKTFDIFSYYSAHGDDLIMKRENYEFVKGVPTTSYQVFDLNTGKNKFEIKEQDNSNLYKIQSMFYDKNAIVVYSLFSPTTKTMEFDNKKVSGIVKISYDRISGKELSRDTFLWSDFGENLKMDANGIIDPSGYLQIMDIRVADNGKTTVIAESYTRESVSTVKDLFVLEFDSNLKLNYFKKIDKLPKKSYFSSWGSQMKVRGEFDYLYSQKLEDNDFVYFYTDIVVEKKKRNKILGIITSIDGVFEYQIIPLRTDNAKIYTIKAKSGYIVLREDSENKSSLRLEKINF